MKVFVTIIIIFLLLRWVLKPLIQFAVKTTLNKMADQANNQSKAYNPTKKEGTISVDYIPEKGKKSKGNSVSDDGEYVDYEEIK